MLRQYCGGVGAVLSGTEEALPRRAQLAEAGRSSARGLSFCERCDADDAHGTVQYAGRRSTVP